MRPSNVAKALRYLINAKQPVMLHGQPGAGKSQVVKQVSEGMGGELIDLRLSQLDPVDLRGIPSITADKRTTWNAPDFLPSQGTGILFLDEINSAAQATQAAAYQLILDRKLGDYTLPEGWAMVAAGNRAKDRAIVNQMSTALKNRLVHIDFEVNIEDWCQWALANSIASEIIGFIRFRPHLLNEFETNKADQDEKIRIQRLKDAQAFATPRSWEFMSKILDQRPEPVVEFDLYTGTVGEGAATEFMAYIKHYRDLPNLDAILMNPATTMVPNEPGTLYALSAGLATKINEDNMDRALIYANRIPVEFQVFMLKDSITRDPKLSQTKAFHNWVNKHGETFL
jgi:hypothetical protein